MCSQITNPLLATNERKWLELFFSIDFFWKETLVKQINAASIGREYHQGHWFVDFDVPCELRTFPKFEDRVPIEMMVQHIESTTQIGEIYYHYLCTRGMPCFWEEGGWLPTSFLLHIYDGAIQELEVYDVGSFAIPIPETYIGRCDYRLSPDFANHRAQ